MNNNNYKKALQQGLSNEDFPKELSLLFNCISKYFSENNNDLSIDDLSNLVFSNNIKDKEMYEIVLENIKSLDVQESTTQELLTSLLTRKKLKELSLLAYEAYEGKKELSHVIDCVSNINSAGDIGAVEEDLFVSDDIEFIVQETFKTPGLRWRLATMNKMLGSLRPGDFGFIFARPETGKTTFLASELTYMAEQAERPVLWFANEEDGKKVMLRLYQATFGVGLSTLLSDLPGWRKKYYDLMGHKLKVVMRRDLMNKRSIEQLCKEYKPSLVVIDQLSKVEGFDDDRKDLELGAATTWSRNLSAIIEAPIVAVHQADGQGENVKWLNMNHVANAKTAMQADADWILGIGCSHGEGYESIRYLHLSKNKLTGDEDTDPGLRHGKMEVIIEPMLGRYKDLF